MNIRQKRRSEEIQQEIREFNEKLSKITNKRTGSISYLKKEIERLHHVIADLRYENNLLKDNNETQGDNYSTSKTTKAPIPTDIPTSDKSKIVEKQETIDKPIAEKNNNDLNDLLTKKLEKVNEEKIQLIQKVDDLEKKYLEASTVSFIDKINKKAKEAELQLNEKIDFYRQKFEKDLEEAKKFVFENQISQLVEIVVNFGNVLKSAPNNPEVKNFVIGFNMFYEMLKQLLTDLKVEEQIINCGDEFNSSFMEAFETEYVDKDVLVNRVISVTSNAYKLHNRIIKYGVVKVGIKKLPQHNN